MVGRLGHLRLDLEQRPLFADLRQLFPLHLRHPVVLRGFLLVLILKVCIVSGSGFSQGLYGFGFRVCMVYIAIRGSGFRVSGLYSFWVQGLHGLYG